MFTLFFFREYEQRCVIGTGAVELDFCCALEIISYLSHKVVSFLLFQLDFLINRSSEGIKYYSIIWKRYSGVITTVIKITL